MKTDKGQFDAVLSRMLKTPPKKESEIKGSQRSLKRLLDRISSQIGKAKRLEPAQTAHRFYEHVVIVAAIKPVFKLPQIPE